MRELKAQQEAKCYEKGLTGGATQDKNEKFCLPLQMQTAEENSPAEAYPRKGIDRMINRRATEGATPQIVLPPDSPPSQQPSVQRESTHQSLPSRLTSSINGGDMVDRSPLRLGRKPPKLSVRRRTYAVPSTYVKEIRELWTKLQARNLEHESPNRQRGSDHKEAVTEDNRNLTKMVV